MAANTWGSSFRVTTFGESHGPAVGCVVDGCPNVASRRRSAWDRSAWDRSAPRRCRRSTSGRPGPSPPGTSHPIPQIAKHTQVRKQPSVLKNISNAPHLRGNT